MKKLIALLMPTIVSITAFAQIDAGLFRYPDVSATNIVFTYANDLWVIPKTGGSAVKLSSPAGVEVFPKFSPDGKKIAFSGNYDGNADAYVIPTTGGVPVRLTSHGYPDRVVDWTLDGNKVLFASSRESGKARFNQFYTVSAAVDLLKRCRWHMPNTVLILPMENKWLLLSNGTLRNWKRYRGGNVADIHIYNFANKTSENISAEDEAAYDFPMWHGNGIYFLSDRGPEQHINIWKYDVGNKALTQVTKYNDVDVHFPSQGPDDIVYEAGGKLYILPFTTLQPKAVNVSVVTDNALLKPRMESAERNIQWLTLSPDGNRVLIQARGDVFSVPAENGFVKDLTHTSGSAERYPAWSPDGRSIAYWSDKSGEYELYLMQTDVEGSEKKLTNYGAGFRYAPFWSPDSKKIVFIDKAMKIQLVDVASGQTTQIDKGLRMMHGPLNNFSVRWSPDSRFFTYNRDLDNYQQAVFIYDYNNKKLHQVTSGFYSGYSPVFDPEGKYLYLLTSQSFQPIYSSIDNSFIYANSGQVAAIALLKTTPSCLHAKNDTVALKLDAPAKKKN